MIVWNQGIIDKSIISKYKKEIFSMLAKIKFKYNDNRENTSIYDAII